jgi:squalene-associated FAD-dependent desaturase
VIAPDVIVIGAGFAGLSAAARLAESGRRVLVVEARAQAGGRATAFIDRATGELVDNGQHVLFGCYRHTLRFLDRIGASSNVVRQPTLAVPYIDERGRRSELRCPSLPAPLHLVAGVLRWSAIPWSDRLSTLRLAGPLRTARAELQRTGHVSVTPSHATVSDWLRIHGQAPKLREWLWEPLAVAALNQAPGRAAAAPFVRVLAEMFGPDPGDAAIVLPTKPLHLMYAEPATRYIEQRGGTVRLNALARLALDGNAVAGIDIRGERVKANRVICAVPWFGLSAMFPGGVPTTLRETARAADATGAMPIVTVNLWYDRRVMDEPFVGLPGRAMQWVFDKRLAFGTDASHLSLVASGAEELVGLTQDELVARAVREVASAIEGARSARLVRGTVVREKRATFALDPGQPARPGVVTGVPGLYLAGDWIDTGLPGTIESAAMSGHLAAETVINDS